MRRKEGERERKKEGSPSWSQGWVEIGGEGCRWRLDKGEILWTMNTREGRSSAFGHMPWSNVLNVVVLKLSLYSSICKIKLKSFIDTNFFHFTHSSNIYYNPDAKSIYRLGNFLETFCERICSTFSKNNYLLMFHNHKNYNMQVQIMENNIFKNAYRYDLHFWIIQFLTY